jgi:hypothetical protein
MIAAFEDQDRSWPQFSQTLSGAPPLAAIVRMLHRLGSSGHVVYATRKPARSITVLTPIPAFPFVFASQVCLPLDRSLSQTFQFRFPNLCEM